jgi:hypothetical protein
MNVSKKFSLLPIFLALILSSCGGGGVGGDADLNVVRTVFAVGEVVEVLEDGGSVEGDVSTNDQGSNLVFALVSGSSVVNGDLVFNDDGTFVYTPFPDFFGEDSVDYTVTDSVSGETDSATLTISVANDFEVIEEYGWNLVWSDDFNSGELDPLLWSAANGVVSGGNLVISAQADMTSSAVGLSPMRLGRVEAVVKASSGVDVAAVFKLAPVQDMYDGKNSLVALETADEALVAGAHYGLGITSGITMNAEMIETVDTDFHTYAIEWGADEIRWYIDDSHVHTVNTLNTWAYHLVGGEAVADNDGPFNQDMQVMFELTLGASAISTSEIGAAASASIIVDKVSVWKCDPSIELSVTDCASRVKSKVTRQASDRIETVGSIDTDIFKGGYFDSVSGIKISDLHPLEWHYTDEIKELTLGTVGAIDVDVAPMNADSSESVIDVSTGSGVTSMRIAVSPSEVVGLETALNFEIFVSSEDTSAEKFDIKMESGEANAGFKSWNIVDVPSDEWVSVSVPVKEFIDNPVSVDGQEMPLNSSSITSLMALEVTGEAQIYLREVSLSCVSSESCIQGPLGLQSEAAPKAEPIRYEAEDYIAESGTGVEDTTDDGGGQNVAFLNAGDYLVYTISAPGIGPYRIDYRVASSGGSDGFNVSIDGVQIDSQIVPDTGDWQNWTTLTSQPFELVVGIYTLRIDFLDDGQNLNWFELLPPITEIFIEAEDFDDESGISLEDTTDDGGGQNIGYIDEGDYVEYGINIPSDGTYLIEYRLASAVDSFGFETSIGGVVVDTQSLLSTGDWQNWITQSAEVDLVAGEQTMRLDFLGGAINVNWIRLTRK